MRSIRATGLFAVVFACSLVLGGCVSVRQIRVENISTHELTNLRIAGQPYGNVGPGEMTDYKTVKLRFHYSVLNLYVDGKYVTGQTLNFGPPRITYQIDVKDLDAGHLAIDLVHDESSAESH